MTVISNGKYDYDTVLDLTMDKLILLYNKIMEMQMLSSMGGLGMGGMSTGNRQPEQKKHWEESIGNNMRREHHSYSIEELFDNPELASLK